MIAFGPLNPAPFIPWEIMHYLANPIRLNVQLVQVIDYHIGRRALPGILESPASKNPIHAKEVESLER